MAERGKKKRKERSVSPDSPGKSSIKRSRTSSNGTNNTLTLRAKSVFRGDRDPYFPKGGEAPPASSDYTFRVNVLCSTQPGDKVFKEAVQGLIKICCPEGMLEETGVKVVEQHMREAEASEDKISRMREVYQEEMVHRVAWMLAGYLDTPQKIETGISTVIAATNRLHGEKYDREILDDMISAFQRLRDALPSDNTEHLATVGLSVPIEDDSESTPIMASSELRDTVARTEEDGRQSNQTVKSAKNMNKISKTWRWDVDPTGLTMDDVLVHFKKPTDLFAYHALPIIKSVLGAGASNLDIRRSMEKSWRELSETDLSKWEDSFRKLRHRDLSMLDRGSAKDRPKDIRATPFPGSASHVTPNGHKTKQEPPAARMETNVLRSVKAEAMLPHANIGTQRTESEHQSHIKEEYNFDDARTSETDSDIEKDGSGSDAPKKSILKWPLNRKIVAKIPSIKTPLVDLLWGKSIIDETDQQHVIDAIRTELDSRIPAYKISLHLVHGLGSASYNKSELTGMIVNIFREKVFDSARVRLKLEHALVPWFAANVNEFPELDKVPFIFCYMLPSSTPVLDLLWPRNIDTLCNEPGAVTSFILRSLKSRKVDTLRQKLQDNRTVEGTVQSITGAGPRIKPYMKLATLERSLREVALARKDKFPELKSTALVKKWESMTGQKW